MFCILGALPPQHTFATASTGVAACHIGGTTLHAFAGEWIYSYHSIKRDQFDIHVVLTCKINVPCAIYSICPLSTTGVASATYSVFMKLEELVTISFYYHIL